MNERAARLRCETLEAIPSISSERAELMTSFYEDQLGKHSVPAMRALAFRHLCEKKTLHLGDGELIVGERGPRPKAVPTFPELTCHSLDDLRILDSRPKTSYAVPDECLAVYEDRIIPFWRGRSLRDRIFAALPEPKQLYLTPAAHSPDAIEHDPALGPTILEWARGLHGLLPTEP